MIFPSKRSSVICERGAFLILDTDILIWFLRGNEKAVNAVLDSMPFSVSIITYMEIVQGMRDKRELEQMKKAFRTMEVQIIPVTERISLRAAEYVEKYALSASMELADALIASTCIGSDKTLFTANDKHYKVIHGLRLNVFRP